MIGLDLWGFCCKWLALKDLAIFTVRWDDTIVASLNVGMKFITIHNTNGAIAGISKIIVHIGYVNEFPCPSEIV